MYPGGTCRGPPIDLRRHRAGQPGDHADASDSADDRTGRVFRLGQRLNSPISFLPHRVRLVRAHVVPPGNAFADLGEAARVVQLFAFPRRVQDGVLPPGRASGGADSV